VSIEGLSSPRFHKDDQGDRRSDCTRRGAIWGVPAAARAERYWQHSALRLNEAELRLDANSATATQMTCQGARSAR
jgi:hypothetical protein